MTRAALVVGVGGTGQWVLTWLKRDLMELYGEVPKNVRLLALDTTAQLEAGSAQMVGGNRQEEEEVRIGDVRLSHQEFLHLGGDALDLAERVREGKYPFIGKWFRAKKWLEVLPQSAFVLDDGAGRIRQLGRLGIFREVVDKGGESLKDALVTFLSSVSEEANRQGKLEIILVGSLAGGTGSGMFLDIALLLRLLARKERVSHVLRGFFALPGVFASSPSEEMKARAFAAWREMNRFMVVNEDFPMPKIRYAESPEWEIRPEERLFEVCYLIDGNRGSERLAEEPKFGAFPAMAEMISMLLDENAGQDYQSFISTNLSPEYAKRAGTPQFSTFGVKVLKIPAKFKQEKRVAQVGEKVVLELLRPVSLPSNEESWLSGSAATRHLQLAASNQNMEDPGFSGRERSAELFSQSVDYEGQTAKPTRFVMRLGEILEQALQESQLMALVDSMARAGFKSGAQGWIAYFTDLGDAPEYEDLRKEIEEHVRYNLLKAYGRREGEKAGEARRRFRKIPEDIRTRYGADLFDADEALEFKGKFWEVLQRVQKVQQAAFRSLVRLRLLRILNGTSEDPIKARTGKLGYAWEFMDGVTSDLHKIGELLDKVRKRREELRPELKMADLRQRARAFLAKTEGKKLLWFWEHPDVREAERRYLLAYQRWMESRREDLLLQMVQDTVRDFERIAMAARDSLQDWIYHLATGDAPSGVNGIWRQFKKHEQHLTEVYGYDQRLREIQKILSEDDEHPELSEQEIREALRRIRWEVAVSEEGNWDVELVLQPKGEKERVLKDPLKEPNVKWRAEISEENYNYFKALLDQFHAGEAEQAKIAEHIKAMYGRGKKGAHDFVEKEGLGDVSMLASVRGAAAQRSTFIRVMAPENDPFFYGVDGVEGEIRDHNRLPRDSEAGDYVIKTVNSENPYKLSVISTQELRPPEKFTAWEEYEEAYMRHLTDEGDFYLNPELLHVFAAESEAARIERRLVVEKHRKPHPLHARVVMLLDNKRGTRQFLWLYMLQRVREVEAEEDASKPAYRWELRLPTGDEEEVIWLTRGWESDRHKESERPDILDAIHGYALYGETREPGRVWKVDYDQVDYWLRNQRRDMGLEGRKKLVEYHLNNEDGILQRLHRLAVDPKRPESIRRRDYADLETVFRFWLEDELKRIQNELQRR